MLQLKNQTPYLASITLFPDAEGIDTLYVVVKGTYEIQGDVALAQEQVPIVQADEYWGEPGESSLKYASEMHLAKPSTDVVLVGHAVAPRGKPVEELDVTLSVGKRSKTIRVFGDRQWDGGMLGLSISKPKPFTSMPLIYEKSFGGVHREDPDAETYLAEERNPVGVGFLGKRKAKEMADQPLPNLEDPSALIKKPGDEPAPAGFGFVSPTWLPRRSFVGTYDETWQKKRAPILPEDFDSRFFNMAHPDLTFDRYLQGGEQVQVKNVSKEGTVRFRLPQRGANLEVDLEGATLRPDLNLETVLVEPDENRLSMTWRAAVSCDKKALKVEEIRIEPRLGVAEVSG